jgi:hypothetical protein
MDDYMLVSTFKKQYIENKIIFMLMILSIIFCSSKAFAWNDTVTHRHLTDQTVNFLKYLHSDLISPDIIEYARKSLVKGAVEEDGCWSTEENGGRFSLRSWFHFLPRINHVIASGEASSIDWAFRPGLYLSRTYIGRNVYWPLRNQHKWSDAIDKLGVIDRDGTDKGLVALGHLLHLIQDLTVPAHVRNDPHPPGNKDVLEKYGEKHVEKIKLPSSNEPLISFTDREKFFQDLSDDVRNNYYSQNSIPQDPFAPDSKPRASYIIDNYLADQSWRKLCRQQYIVSNPSYPIDDLIQAEQFSELSAKAILYGARFIIHFYNKVKAILPTIQENFNNDNFNHDLFQIYTQSGPWVVTVKNRLEIWIPSDSYGNYLVGSLFSKFKLSGDFDVQVDFGLLDWPASSGISTGINTSLPSSVLRTSFGPEEGGSREIYYLSINGHVTQIPTTDTTGKLRMKREGNKIEGFYWHNNAWQSIASYTDSTYGMDLGVNISAHSSTPSHFSGQKVRVALDNLLIANY